MSAQPQYLTGTKVAQSANRQQASHEQSSHEPSANQPHGQRQATQPPLRVLPGGRRRALSLSARSIFSLAAAVVFCAALTIVSSQAVLAKGQFQLEQLKLANLAAQAREQRLTFEVANLSAPQRVVSTAEKKLGMVVPSHVTYLASTQASQRQR